MVMVRWKNHAPRLSVHPIRVVERKPLVTVLGRSRVLISPTAQVAAVFLLPCACSTGHLARPPVLSAMMASSMPVRARRARRASLSARSSKSSQNPTYLRATWLRLTTSSTLRSTPLSRMAAVDGSMRDRGCSLGEFTTQRLLEATS